MKATKYFRKRNIIRSPDGDKKFESITAAKRHSRSLQLGEDRGLGRGSLQVVEEFPKAEARK